MERERQAEGAVAGGLHQARRDAHAQLKRLTKDLQAPFAASLSFPRDNIHLCVLLGLVYCTGSIVCDYAAELTLIA